MYKLNQNEYESIVFLTKCVYYEDLVYPTLLGYQHSVVLLSGLRMNLFIGKDFDLIVICGTNQVRDWITNLKVGLGITPRQYQQALSRIMQHYSTMDKNKTLIISGHSLGFGIAEYCASFMSDDVLAIGFNGCPVNHLCTNKDSGNIINIISEHDILNNLCSILPGKCYMKHLGDVITLPDKYRLPCIKSHCDFETFMKYRIEKEV